MSRKTELLMLVKSFVPTMIHEVENLPDTFLDASGMYECEGESRSGHMEIYLKVRFKDHKEKRDAQP